MGRGNLTPQEIELKKTISSNLNTLLQVSKKKKVDINREVGIPKSTISDYFKGNSLPTKQNVKKLAEFFNVPDYEIDPRFKKHTTEDNNDGKLEKMLDNAVSFEGNPITPNDRKLLKDWLKVYYKNKNED